MEPEECIADLDESLAMDGEDVVLQRMTAGVTVADECTVRAKVSEAGSGRPQDLIGNVVQGDTILIMSPTQIAAVGWTAGRASGDDDRVPTKGNRVIRAGRALSVQKGFGIFIRGELVRIEVHARG